MTPQHTTHETFIQRVRQIVIDDALRRDTISKDEAVRLEHTKLLYGVGRDGVRGTCYYKAWENGIGTVEVVEISALVEESWVQLAGTVIHELGHVLAEATAGHSKAWKDTTVRLGFVKRPEAAGQNYSLALFNTHIRTAVYALAAELGDGKPAFATFGTLPRPVKLRPCSAGIGTRGGTSRGKGSGSRLRLYECECTPKPFKVRVSSDDFAAHCDKCGAAFTRKN